MVGAYPGGRQSRADRNGVSHDVITFILIQQSLFRIGTGKTSLLA